MSTAVHPTTAHTADADSADLISALAEPSAAIAEARAAKPVVVAQTEAAHEALFDGAGSLTADFRHALAARVAAQQGSSVLAAHHAELTELDLGLAAADAHVGAIVRHTDLLSLAPALATAADVSALGEHLEPDDVVLLGQLVAFTSYEARLIEGLRLLSGRPGAAEHPAGLPEPAPSPTLPAGRAKYHPTTAPNGLPAPQAYTTDVLGWLPWVEPVATEDLTPAQIEAFRGKTNGAYFRLLARHVEALAARTRIDHAIFATKVGLPRAERELAAAITSRVNDCIYCASVHARKAAQLSKRADDVASVLAAPLAREGAWVPGDLGPLAAAVPDERWAAIINLAAALAASPSRATTAQVDRLRELGLSDLELVDLACSVAFFSWANRLMLTLGEPYVPDAGAAGRDRA